MPGTELNRRYTPLSTFDELPALIRACSLAEILKAVNAQKNKVITIGMIAMKEVKTALGV